MIHDLEEYDNGPNEQELEDADRALREPGHRLPGGRWPWRDRTEPWSKRLSDWEIARERQRDWEDGYL